MNRNIFHSLKIKLSKPKIKKKLSNKLMALKYTKAETMAAALTKFKSTKQIMGVNVAETATFISTRKKVPKIYSTVFLPEIEIELVARVVGTLDLGFRITFLTLRNLMKLYFDRTGQRIERFRYNIPTEQYIVDFLAAHQSLIGLRIGPGSSRYRFYSEITKNSMVNDFEVKIEDHRQILDNCFIEIFEEMGNANIKCL